MGTWGGALSLSGRGIRELGVREVVGPVRDGWWSKERASLLKAWLKGKIRPGGTLVVA